MSYNLPVNVINTYAPAGGVARVLLTLMIRGSGHLVLRNFSVRPVTRLTLLFETLSSWYRDGKQWRQSRASKRASTANNKIKAPATAPVGSARNLTHQILSALAGGVPVSNGSSYGGILPLNVAIVTDEFMYNFYRGAFAELHYLSPTNFEEVLSSQRIDAFLFVTCWNGLHNDEWRGLRYRERPASALENIIEHCRENEIKTIFQSIEDPSNFDNFIEIAKLFECVFTADADIIPKYAEYLNHERVYYGEYGANPLLNNPIGCRRPMINGAFFAGSYPKRYAERCADMEIIFSSVANADVSLVIADRNYNSGQSELVFPKLVAPSCHSEVLSRDPAVGSQAFRYNINRNSIKHSSTMCAMRVSRTSGAGPAGHFELCSVNL